MGAPVEEARSNLRADTVRGKSPEFGEKTVHFGIAGDPLSIRPGPAWIFDAMYLSISDREPTFDA
jgi:hypothetical protein